jgi:hypothetical protein
MLAFPAGVKHAQHGWTVDHFIKDSWTAVVIGGISGLLLSSVAFSIEVLLRFFSVTIDCDWFPRVAFEKVTDKDNILNFFAGETFMHLNIALGVFVILLYFMITVTWNQRWSVPHGYYKWHPAFLVFMFIVLVASNLIVSSYLFHRVADIAYGQIDAADSIAGKECRCLSRHGGPGPDCPKPKDPKAAALVRELQSFRGPLQVAYPGS